MAQVQAMSHMTSPYSMSGMTSSPVSPHPPPTFKSPELLMRQSPELLMRRSPEMMMRQSREMMMSQSPPLLPPKSEVKSPTPMNHTSMWQAHAQIRQQQQVNI